MRRYFWALVLLLFALGASVAYADGPDNTVKTNVGMTSTGATSGEGSRVCAQAYYSGTLSRFYIATTRSSSAYAILMVSADNGATWTKYVDSTLWGVNTSANPNITLLNDTMYLRNTNSTAPQVGKFYYNATTTRDTMIIKSTITATAENSPGALRVAHVNDSLVTIIDTASTLSFAPEMANGHLIDGTTTWAKGTPKNIGSGYPYTFDVNGKLAVYQCGTRTLFITNGHTIDSIYAPVPFVSQENYATSGSYGRHNLSFLSRTPTDTMLAVLWEINDSLELKIGYINGAYPHTWTPLCSIRVDSRTSPVGDTNMVRKDGKLSMLGNVMYIIYKDWRRTAAIDSADIVERHIDLTSLPANNAALSSGLSAETIFRPATNATPIVDLQTPEYFNNSVSTKVIWAEWVNNAAAGSKTMTMHVDTVSLAAASISSVTVDSLHNDYSAENDSIKITSATGSGSGDSVITTWSTTSYPDSGTVNPIGRAAKVFVSSSNIVDTITANLTETYVLYVSSWVKYGSTWSTRVTTTKTFTGAAAPTTSHVRQSHNRSTKYR
jgi:hypothetical protein